jgi:hypothetical protein
MKNIIVFCVLSISIFSATLKSQPKVWSQNYMSFEINAISHEDAEILAETILEIPLNVTYKNKYGTWWYWSQSKGIIVTISKNKNEYGVEVEKGSFNDFKDEINADKRY